MKQLFILFAVVASFTACTSEQSTTSNQLDSTVTDTVIVTQTDTLVVDTTAVDTLAK